ncbi:MAG: HAD-IIIC family phosphatase [Patescibacteria group bacterium]
MDFKTAKKIIFDLTANRGSVADYINLAKEIFAANFELPEYVRKIKVAFLSNFTILGLPEVFKAKALFHNIAAETYQGTYNQYAQEILNPESGLNKFQPKLIYLLIDYSDVDKNQIAELVEKAKEGGAKVVLIDDFSDFKEHWYTKYKDLGDMRLALDAFPALAEKLVGTAVAVSGATKKCLVLDLDNTLWSGIVGEDGADKVVPNKKLQEHILNLYKTGTILAINSKNNEADAMEVIEKHPDMLLRKNHFATWQINWNDKASNIRAIADELMLGTDSFVFVDDDPFQQSLVAESCPEVAVMHPDNLIGYVGFSSAKLTAEDERRGEMYAEERARRSVQSSLKSVNDFLKDLKLEVTIREVKADSPIIPRLSQMTQKTNQFNMQTVRWSEGDIKALLSQGNRMWAIDAVDRFGDYGIIGFLSASPEDKSVWVISNFLMSCRILGRGIEKSFLANLIKSARENGVAELIGEFSPTKKNKSLCEKFYLENNFKAIGEVNGVFRYHYDFTKDYPYPNLVKVNFA